MSHLLPNWWTGRHRMSRIYTQHSWGEVLLPESLATILLAGGLTSKLVMELDRLEISTRRVFSDLARFNDEYEGSPLEKELVFAVDPGRSTVRLTELGWD